MNRKRTELMFAARESITGHRLMVAMFVVLILFLTVAILMNDGALPLLS